MMEIEITTEMLMVAVEQMAAQSDFQALVNEQIAKAMADYLHRDDYGGSHMQRATRKFIDGVALEVLERNRAAITAAVDRHIQEKLDDMTQSAVAAIVSRMEMAIK